MAGNRIGNVPDRGISLNEMSLFFGQDLSNKYIHSKFMAERAVLEAALQGLDAKIMRVGNLMARSADGESQVNFNTNSFLGLLKAYSIVGNVPFSILGDDVEFPSVDHSAKAVLLLSETPLECIVFHPYNNHTVFFRDILDSMAKSGVCIQRHESDVWNRKYSEAIKDPAKAKYLLSLFAYKSRERHQAMSFTESDNTFTVQTLDRLGFTWQIVSESYLTKFMEAMKGLGFFDANGRN